MGRLVKSRSDPYLPVRNAEKFIPIPLNDPDQLTDPECREIMRFQDLKYED